MRQYPQQKIKFLSAPISGADGRTIDVDIVAEHVDVAVIEDIGSIILRAAGRPQPPQAIAIVDFICALRIAVCSSLTPSRAVGREILFRFFDAEQEHFVVRCVAGICAILRICICGDSGTDYHFLMIRSKCLVIECFI